MAKFVKKEDLQNQKVDFLVLENIMGKDVANYFINISQWIAIFQA